MLIVLLLIHFTTEYVCYVVVGVVVGVRNQLIEKEHFEKHKVVFIMMRFGK